MLIRCSKLYLKTLKQNYRFVRQCKVSNSSQITSTIMETRTIETKTNDEMLLQLIQDFFDCRKPNEHLQFLDNWLEKALARRLYKKHLHHWELPFFATKFSNLIQACYEINATATCESIYFNESVKISANYLLKEQRLLLFYPNLLRVKEICKPLLVFQHVFKQRSFNFYSLSAVAKYQSPKTIFQVYNGLKRIVEACWLIHERSISKNSFRDVFTINPNNAFALSCPLLLTDEFVQNPYLMVEEFFSYGSIEEYKRDLAEWFSLALNDEEGYENATDLVFIHNQFLQLIQAAYLIGTCKMPYLPKTPYTSQHETFGHWILDKMETSSFKKGYRAQYLSLHFQENPIHYCIENMTINDVTKLRYGLKEWLEAALSKNRNITHLPHCYIFDQFKELHSIMEAAFLLVAQPALTNRPLATSPIY
jgi:hypothetical protein